MRNDEMVSIAAELKSSSDGYLQRPIPCPLDTRVDALVDAYRNGDESARGQIAETLGPDQSFALLVYAERMAIASVRQNSAELLDRALIGIMMEGFRRDARETLIALSLIDHSAKKLGLDLRTMVGNAAALGGSSMNLLRDFCDRSDPDRSIASMGYYEGKTETGQFTYLRNW
jgi:hypothetical protein